MTHHHSHSIEQPAQTEGQLIRWAPYYDLSVNLITFGQAWRLRKMTVDHALIKPGDNVLDVGCGTGEIAIPAKIRAGKGGHVYGIDPAPEMIAVARNKAARKGFEIDFRVGVIESLPFTDSSMDVVTSSLMMHHMTDDLRTRGWLRYRVLKPGGRLLVFDFMRPTKSFLNQFLITLTMHHGLNFGIEDLPKMLEDAHFNQAVKLDEKFLFFGFVRAIK
jgi:demethylmenaquinone methyltransferase/2-methoxy-6-polyprenyl-1,4-benzoquinol methylase/phosphoethanolamine N-methyltransferase